MADYIYLLENRLSHAQRQALNIVREVARSKGSTVFLVGGAVRDLTSGSPVRDLDVAVQGNALKLRKDLEKAGAVVTGENEPGQALYLRFAGNVRMELASTQTVTFPKPGKPVVKPAALLDDLRRRDFTANSMALSLNEGSYGLLMDPLNGVADIENRELRLVSNYGFIEDPVRMIRAARLMARLGWTLDEKTEARYQTGKQEGYIGALSEFQRGYELEELFHEEDPLRVLRRLESEGWMKALAPAVAVSKASTAELDRMRDVQTQLEMQNLRPATGAAYFPLLTAKLTAGEVAQVKAAFPRQGFVREIESLEAEGKAFAAELAGKEAATPSVAWRLLVAAAPESVLWAAFYSKSAPVQARLKSFATEWPLARHRMPWTTMQEMRITPDLPGYEALLEGLFFALMDGQLTTPEEMKAYLEPHSPPAPPPPPSLRRVRAAAKKESRSRSKSKKAVAAEPQVSEPAADTVEPAVAESTAPVQVLPAKELPAKRAVATVPAAAVPDAPAATKSISAKPGKRAPGTEGAAPVKPADKPAATVKAPAAEKAAKAAPVKTASILEKKAPSGRKAMPTAAASKPVPAKAVVAKAVPAKAVMAKVSAAAKSAPARTVAGAGKPVKKAEPVRAAASKAPGGTARAKTVVAPVKSVTKKSAPAQEKSGKDARPSIAAKGTKAVAGKLPAGKGAAPKTVPAKTVPAKAISKSPAVPKKAAAQPAKKTAAKAVAPAKAAAKKKPGARRS